MQNKLKPVTIKCIGELNDADIRTIMATGDNMLTAISVGRKCGIVPGDQIVYLADLAEVGDKQGIFWKIAKESEALLQDHYHPAEIIKNQNISNLLPWEKDQEENFSISITGKAFNFLVKEPSMKAVLH